MLYDENIKEEDYFDNELKDEPLSLKQVAKSNRLFVKWFIEHYPKSKGIVGRTLNFLIYSYGKPIGIIGFASPPLNYKKFNIYFKLDETNKSSENAKLFLNNNVFRIIHTEKNLATKVLKMARKIVFDIYKEKYNQELLGLVTFVEPPRTGALYKADNWDYLGETEGIEVKRRGEDWTNKQYIKGVSKLIYGYTYKVNKNYKNNFNESHIELYKCEVCGKFISEDKGITTLNGLWVCDDNNCRTLDEENQAIEKEHTRLNLQSSEN